MRTHCNGIRISGYWKGNQCCAVPTLRSSDGKTWCRNHAPINEKLSLIKEKKK